MTAAQCKALQTEALMEVLPKIGMNRHFPRAVLFGSKKYGGCEFISLYEEQGMIAIREIISNVRARTCVGDLLEISLKNTQLELGTKT